MGHNLNTELKMIKNQIKQKLKVSLFILILINIIGFVNALGVSAPYWSTNPLELFPGESKDVEFTLQNIDARAIKVHVELTSGSEVATLTKEEYTVSAESNSKATVKVKIPQNTQYGKEYIVKLQFRQVKVETEGMVQLASGIDTSFPVIVKAPLASEPIIEEEKPALTNSFLVVMLTLILIVGYIMLKKKKEE